MTDQIQQQELAAKFEELSALELEFEDAEVEIIRKAEAIQSPLYKKRADFVATIPHFWSLVFEQAPPGIDTFIQPSDSAVFAECLDKFEVSRFELNDPKGSPRSFSLKFEFTENKYFENKVIEKKFWYRKTVDWAGLVSEPVRINWKKGNDLSSGLTDAACDLHEARTKLKLNTANGEARRQEAQLPEYKSLATKIETVTDSSVSFFSLFAFVSGYRWVSQEESEQVVNEDREKCEKIRKGIKVEEDDEDNEEDPHDYQEVEVFPGGDEAATVIAEDMWQNAIKYYKQTFEDDFGSDLEDSDISDVEDMEEDDSEVEDEQVDIRALVGKGRNAGQGPPAKKQRKN